MTEPKNNQPNQSKGKRGGARPGAGRKPGKVSAAKKMIAEQAREYGVVALHTLVEVALKGSDSARVAAANALLDRGYGKPVQGVELSGPEGGDIPVRTLNDFYGQPDT